MAEHRPEGAIYDIAPPYADNWKFLQLLRNTPEFGDVALVVTTVNKRALEREVGRTDAFEIIGTRDDLAPIVTRSTSASVHAATVCHANVARRSRSARSDERNTVNDAVRVRVRRCGATAR